MGRILSTQVANTATVHCFSLGKETRRFLEYALQFPAHRRGYHNIRHRVTSCGTVSYFVRRLAEESIARNISSHNTSNGSSVSVDERKMVPYFLGMLCQITTERKIETGD